MKKYTVKTIILILFYGQSWDSFSQIRNIYFSTTGDTICYSNVWGQSVDSSSRISYTTYIKHREENNNATTISSFQIICEPSNKCLENISKDTINKYNLHYDGNDAYLGTNKDFLISVKPTNIHVIDTSAFGPKFIYQTTLSVNIECKGQKLYSKTFNIMFKGNSPKDFPEHDFVRINAWCKKNTKRYFIDLNVKEIQTFKKPHDTPDYIFQSFLFIL